MPAILFGSIGSLADTSELQREAFNDAFEAHGLDWDWSREQYTELLEHSGGAKRIAEYAASRDQQVDAAAVHRTKSARFQELLAGAELHPRAGVTEVISAGKGEGFKVALVTTTSAENISALFRALRPELDEQNLDLVVDASQVQQAKPDEAVYVYALEQLGEPAGDCVAVEDNLDGVRAAQAAALACVGFPGQNTAAHDFGKADVVVDEVRLSALKALIESA